MFTDSHCHLYDEYYNNLDEIIELSIDNNINRLINNGCDNKSNIEVLEKIAKFDIMYGAIGIHPENVNTFSMSDIEFIEKNLDTKKVIAIGEIGLDYYYTKENKNRQIELFKLQLELAQKHSIPVIIHSREATLDTINILKEFNVKGLIHSFSGSLETAREYIKMGFLIGINGVTTFKNSNLKDVIKELPLESIVLETDSPYLTPEPYRGKQNNPSHILDIAKFVCELKDIKLDDLSNITNNNLNKIFNKLN